MTALLITLNRLHKTFGYNLTGFAAVIVQDHTIRSIKMYAIKELYAWDMDCTIEPDEYDGKHVPKANQENMVTIINKVNELVERVNELIPASMLQNE